MEAPANVDSRTEDPLFAFSTPEYRLTASGVTDRVTPTRWDGPAVADAVDALLDRARGDRIVVGSIPFDTTRPAELYVPEHVPWKQADARS